MSNELPKILIIGNATHGKDTVGELMEGYGFKYMASSSFATDRIMMPYFESIGKPYSSSEEAYADRVNHRSVWYDQIEAYNSPTWNRVTCEMFEDGVNVYVGMRSEKEFCASRELYEHVIWVDASKRLPPEDISSNTMSPDMADYIIDNNGTLEELKHNVGVLTNLLILNKRLGELHDTYYTVAGEKEARVLDVLIGQMLIGENSEFNLDYRTLRNGKMPCPRFTSSTDTILTWLIPENSSLEIKCLPDGSGEATVDNKVKHIKGCFTGKTPALAAVQSIISYYLASYHVNFCLGSRGETK